MIYILVFLGSIAWAEPLLYLPNYETLVLRPRVSFRNSAANINNDNIIEPLEVDGVAVTNRDLILSLDADYGVTEAWAIGAKLDYLSGSIKSDSDTLFEGAGFHSGELKIKHYLGGSAGGYYLEGFGKLYSNPKNLSQNDLTVENGSFDVGARLRLEYYHQFLYLYAMPGITGRTGGYATSVSGEGAFGLRFREGFLGVKVTSDWALAEERLQDSSRDTHDAPNTGGSLTRVNGFNRSFELGGEIGLRFSKHAFLIGEYKRTLFGQHTPELSTISAQAMIVLDFFEPAPKKKRLYEVPISEPNIQRPTRIK